MPPGACSSVKINQVRLPPGTVKHPGHAVKCLYLCPRDETIKALE